MCRPGKKEQPDDAEAEPLVTRGPLASPDLAPPTVALCWTLLLIILYPWLIIIIIIIIIMTVLFSLILFSQFQSESDDGAGAPAGSSSKQIGHNGLPWILVTLQACPWV